MMLKSYKLVVNPMTVDNDAMALLEAIATYAMACSNRIKPVCACCDRTLPGPDKEPPHFFRVTATPEQGPVELYTLGLCEKCVEKNVVINIAKAVRILFPAHKITRKPTKH